MGGSCTFFEISTEAYLCLVDGVGVARERHLLFETAAAVCRPPCLGPLRGAFFNVSVTTPLE